MTIDLIWVGAGLVGMGIFIGEGLKHFGKPQLKSEDFMLVKEQDLHLHFFLSAKEMKDLLSKHTDAPKIVLEGTTYYPFSQFKEWLANPERYQK